jgi:hypothetical protein
MVTGLRDCPPEKNVALGGEISGERAPRVDSGTTPRSENLTHYRGFYGSQEKTKYKAITNT